MSRDRGAGAKGAESIRSEAGIGIPQIIAGEVDVLPADRSEVGKQRVRDNFAAAAQLIERTAEIHGVPERNGGGDEREPARTILLRLGCAITQSAEAMKANSAGKGVARLALVEFRGRLPPESRQLEPVEHEQCALDPTDFAQGQRQPVLARVGAEALEEQRSARCAGSNRCCKTQNVVPMRRDQLFVDAPGDERLKRGPATWCTKSIKAPLRQVGDARSKIETEQIRQGEDVIADTTTIGVVGRDAQVGFVGRAARR
jgi:hypothetical protein